MFHLYKYQKVLTLFLPGLFFVCLSSTDPARADVELSGRDYAYLRKMIFQNECSGKDKNIVAWNEGEEFPSLGLGHFIWYTGSGNPPYKETFPQLLAYMEKNGAKIPEWIKELPERKAPWKTREEFLSEETGPRVTSLRSFLTQTTRLQTSFIAQRVKDLLPKLLEGLPSDSQKEIRRKFRSVAASKEGLFALIDYTQFKGEGLYETERYQNQGWGLLQVLQEMKVSKRGPAALREFIRAAKEVLERRVQNSPPERNEGRWLTGWKNRVDSYKPKK